MFEEIAINQNNYLNTVKNELTELDKQTVSIKVETDLQYGLYSDILKTVKQKIKIIDERRKEITKPLNDYVKERNAEFKPFIEFLESKKEIIEKEMLRFGREKAEKLRIEAEQKRQDDLKRLKEEEELQRMKAELTENKIDSVKADVLAIKQKELAESEVKIQTSFKTSNTNTIISENWDFEIIDEKQVPLDFCSPDPKKIKAAIKNGMKNIPGLRIFDKGKITSK